MSRRLVSIVPQGTTLTVQFAGLYLSNAHVTDATVSLTALVSKHGAVAVTGVSLPVALAYVAAWESALDAKGKRIYLTDGNYEGVIPHGSSMVSGGFYYATIVATSGTKVRTFREELEVTAGEA